MPRIFGRLYERLGASYSSTYVVFEFVSAFVVCLATVGIFSLYTETSAAEFWRVVAVAEGVVAIAVTYAVIREWTLSRPIIEWIRAGRPDDDALDVWRCAVGMPRQLVLADGCPCTAGRSSSPVRWWLSVTPPSSTFSSELFMRPVLGDIASHLPPDFGGARLGVPLRWKLLGALPLIYVITGVVWTPRWPSGCSRGASCSRARSARSW